MTCCWPLWDALSDHSETLFLAALWDASSDRCLHGFLHHWRRYLLWFYRINHKELLKEIPELGRFRDVILTKLEKKTRSPNIEGKFSFDKHIAIGLANFIKLSLGMSCDIGFQLQPPVLSHKTLQKNARLN